MLSGVREKFNLEIEIISKSRDAYRAAPYQATGLPVAPAIMLENEVVVRGAQICVESLEAAIRRHLASE